MHSSILIVSALSIVVSGIDTWGPAISFGPSKSTIIYSTTTIQPPESPVQPKDGFLTIWPGISNSTNDLIQSTLDSFDLSNPKNNCSGISMKPGDWCAQASVFGNDSFPGDPNLQHDGPATIVRKGQLLQIEYKLEPDNLNWTQTVTDIASKKVISTLSSRSEAYMRGWGTAVECQKDCNPPGLHHYFNTSIKFKEAERDFTANLVSYSNATCSKPVSVDGGITWSIAKITIPATKRANSTKRAL
ncbi:hypothetical protein E2P81_ATG07872 [Venturia nashicola]|nr:hypothetical protein E2P81_ATG07872 [Venturia nashicola]